MRQVGPKRWITKITGILLPLGLLHGCGGFARYGVNAQRPNPNYLFAAITHGAATGRAATLLGSRSLGNDQARRLVLTAFLRQLSETDIKTAASSTAPMPRRCAGEPSSQSIRLPLRILIRLKTRWRKQNSQCRSSPGSHRVKTSTERI
jgi:hypothetical protein